jgi:uncharacterized protein DUF6527
VNTQSCVMTHFVGTIQDWWDQDPPIGSWFVHETTVDQAEPECKPRDGQPTVTVRYFTVMLPSGTTCTIPLRPVPQTGRPVNGGHSWEYDGHPALPTLTPSINSTGIWHGWVRAGRLVSC